MIDFVFVKSVLREYSSDEQSAITGIIEAVCKVDGLTDEIEDEEKSLAYTYKAIAELASGDSLSEKVGNVSRERKDAPALAYKYQRKYETLLRQLGITHTGDNTGPALPRIVQ